MTVWSMLMVEAVNPFLLQLQEESGAFALPFKGISLISLPPRKKTCLGVLVLLRGLSISKVSSRSVA